MQLRVPPLEQAGLHAVIDRRPRRPTPRRRRRSHVVSVQLSLPRTMNRGRPAPGSPPPPCDGAAPSRGPAPNSRSAGGAPKRSPCPCRQQHQLLLAEQVRMRRPIDRGRAQPDALPGPAGRRLHDRSEAQAAVRAMSPLQPQREPLPPPKPDPHRLGDPPLGLEPVGADSVRRRRGASSGQAASAGIGNRSANHGTPSTDSGSKTGITGHPPRHTRRDSADSLRRWVGPRKDAEFASLLGPGLGLDAGLRGLVRALAALDRPECGVPHAVGLAAGDELSSADGVVDDPGGARSHDGRAGVALDGEGAGHEGAGSGDVSSAPGAGVPGHGFSVCPVAASRY